jgi:uncharacterized protein (UPF0548 family)
VLTLRAPSESDLAEFLRSQAASSFSYPEVGASRGELPPRYRIDRRKDVIGRGDAAFDRARQALDRWEMHRGAGVGISPIEPPREGLTVALVVKQTGLHMTSACRVVYTIAEPARHGFGYGTLADHPVAGEERFVVEHESNGEVTFELCAFSRANSLLFKLATPIARRKQLALGAAYVAALRRLVS